MPNPGQLTALEQCIKYDLSYTDSKQDWPDHFRSLFQEIENIGTKTYRTWKRHEHSRKSASKRASMKIIRIATDNLATEARLLNAGRAEHSEAAWRELESHMFKPLKYNPNCGSCKDRLWRVASSVPVDTLSIDTDLLSRQKMRRQRGCDEKLLDSTILGHLVDKAVHLPEEVVLDIGKSYERPDAIYRLRRHGRVKKYLGLAANYPERELDQTPMKKEGSKLCVYPFLILEVKSASAKESQLGVEYQLTFSTRETLLIQKDVALGPEGKNGGELAFQPLVWCITYRGSDYSILAAYLTLNSHSHGVDDYSMNIATLHSGKLNSQDGALQFLLSMFLIANWARDIYRENIIKQLAVYASHNPRYPRSPSPAISLTSTVRSLQNSTAIDRDESSRPDETPTRRRRSNTRTSLGDAAPTMPQTTPSLQRRGLNGGGGGAAAVRRRLFSSQRTRTPTVIINEDISSEILPDSSLPSDKVTAFAFRDAKFIRSKMIGLCITKRNIEQISTYDSEGCNRLRHIVRQLGKRDVALMSGHTLVELEMKWSGRSAAKLGDKDLRSDYLVLLTFSAYISPKWQQTKELCYIAVAENALEKLYSLAKKKADNIFQAYLDSDCIIQIVDLFLNVCMRGNLTACLYRCSIVPRFLGSYISTDSPTRFEYAEEQTEWKWLLWKDASSRNLVCDMHSPAYIQSSYGFMGDYNVAISYLRSSSHVEQQPLLTYVATNTGCPWRIRVLTNGIFKPWRLSNSKDMFLCYDGNKEGLLRDRIPEWCLFYLTLDATETLPTIFATRRVGIQIHWSMKSWNSRLMLPIAIKKDKSSRLCLREFKRTLGVRIRRQPRDVGLTALEDTFSSMTLRNQDMSLRSLSGGRQRFDNIIDHESTSSSGSDTEHEYAVEGDESDTEYNSTASGSVTVSSDDDDDEGEDDEEGSEDDEEGSEDYNEDDEDDEDDEEDEDD